MLDKRYGRNPGQSKEAFPVADWLYGHRIILGQNWLEYTLEFLNVLAGYDYELGRGIDMFDGVENPQPDKGDTSTYIVQGRFGLRRFVFYDDNGSGRGNFDKVALE